ncbi:MAG: hypothetical protein EBS19_05770, partial [Spirochaetia bacterium]|nr:hypothetical protein [Spirochaetia bacterium]
MDYELYTEVVLTKNLNRTKFKKGDVATVTGIEEIGKKRFLKLEFFTILGESMGIFTVNIESVKSLQPNGIVNI